MSNPEALLEEFLQWLTIEKGRSRATIEAYRRDLDRVLTWFDERGIDLAAAHERDLEHYVGELRASGLATSTIARMLASLRGWFAFMVDEGHVSEDPSSRLTSGRRGRSLPKPLDEDDVIALLDSIPSTTPVDRRDRALLELLYGTGARVSEVVGLSLSDLDFDEELILVTGKGSKQRLVPMGTSLRSALREYLEPGGRSALLRRARTSTVFVNARSGPLTRQGIDLIIHKRALAIGIDRSRVSAHVFRHSCATHMLAHGADIRVVQELLGHASIATTQLYTAVSAVTLRDAYLQAHPRSHG